MGKQDVPEEVEKGGVYCRIVSRLIILPVPADIGKYFPNHIIIRIRTQKVCPAKPNRWVGRILYLVLMIPYFLYLIGKQNKYSEKLATVKASS